MGINHLELSPDLLSALFPDSLVDTGKTVSVSDIPVSSRSGVKKNPVISFLGGNRRSVTFLSHYPEDPYLPEDQMAFLNKMLSACKYSMEDIALVNRAKQDTDITILKDQLGTRILFLWGVDPKTAGYRSDLPDFLISEVEGISVIPVPKPERIIGDSAESTELKKRLWLSLKKIFNL